jgi:hypothetical protein
MIIRRQHTANFTTIGNALFEDERLAADEVGILAFLLSRPHDWEIRRPALMRRWHIGQAALKRIVDNWMRTGWCHAQKIRHKDTGTFEIIYQIRDQPGPSLSEDEIRRALSLVSSEVATDESCDKDPAEDIPEDPQSTPHLASTGSPPPGDPPLADRGVGFLLKKDSTKTEREIAREHSRKAKGLAAFEARWPTAMADDRAKTATAWNALSEAEEEPAIAGVGPFLEDMKRHGRKHPPAGWKYLEQKRWTLLAAVATPQKAAPGAYEPQSREGRAILALARIARYSPVRLSDGRISFRGEVTPQLLAMADPPPDDGPPTAYVAYARGTPNFGSWNGLIHKAFAGCNLPSLPDLAAPYPFAPSISGKVYSGSDPPQFEPGTLATEEDLREFG